MIGSLFGGRRTARSIASSLSRGSSRRSRSSRTRQRVSSAEEKAERRIADIEELEAQLVVEVAAIDAKWRDRASDVEPVEIGLEKSDIDVDDIAVVWLPIA